MKVVNGQIFHIIWKYVLEVDDKANSAGIVIDAIRLAKIALDRGMGGPIIPASAYLMKHPIQQMTDPIAKTEIEKFVKGE